MSKNERKRVRANSTYANDNQMRDAAAPTLPRRLFLGTSVAGTAGVLGVPALAEAAPRDTNPTAVVPLGRELTASRIGIGTGMRGWERESNQTRLGEEGFDRLLNYCYDQGIRLFDAADLYGTHRHIARAMTGKPRDSYTVVSKIWWRPRGLQEEERPDADVCVKRFLKELDTDYIDLVHLHCVTDPNWPEQLRRQMDILEDLKQQGMIRAHGVSCHSLEALRTAAEEPWVDAVNARVNPFGRKTDGPMEKVVPVLRTMQQGGKGIIGMKLCGEGTLDAEQRHESLRYVMSERLVDVMIVGFESIEQVDAMLAGVRENLARA